MPSVKPRRGEFLIATRTGSDPSRTGYVLGEFAAHREPGNYGFWTITHLPTGYSVSGVGAVDRKDEALRILDYLAAHASGLRPVDAAGNIVKVDFMRLSQAANAAAVHAGTSWELKKSK